MSGSEKNEACFGVVFDAQGEVVDAGPVEQRESAQSKGGFLVLPTEESRPTISLTNVNRVTSMNIFITENSPACCWIRTQMGWKCVPC